MLHIVAMFQHTTASSVLVSNAILLLAYYQLPHSTLSNCQPVAQRISRVLGSSLGAIC